MNILQNTLRTCANALTLGSAAKLLAEKKKYDEIHNKHSALQSKVQNNQLSIKKAKAVPVCHTETDNVPASILRQI